MSRKTFYLDDDETKPITAGGVLIYKFNKNNEMKLLLIDSRDKYEDFGGRVDSKDRSIYSTVSREAFEESNELLDKQSIRSRIKTAPYVYIKIAKYIVYIIEATETEAQLTMSDFGTKEIYEDINRKVKWISLEKFLEPEMQKQRINWRLTHYNIASELKNIMKQKILTTSIFKKRNKN